MSALATPIVPEKKEETIIPIKVEIPKDSVLNRIVPPHSKESRQVTDKDIDRVVEESKILHQICFTPMGLYQGAYAMHHSQIDDKDPLSLFVTSDRKIIINPKITRHSNYTVDSKEACRTFSDQPQIIVQRWRKIEIDYQTVMVDPDDKDKFKLSSVQHESQSGFDAFVTEHEVDHGMAKYIYPINKK